MTSTEEGDAAIAALNGRAYRGHVIAVAANGSPMFGSMNMPNASEGANARDTSIAAADDGARHSRHRGSKGVR